MIPRNGERWREFAVGRTVPAEEVERAAAVAGLCRPRRSLDEVAVRLALTSHAVAPEALAQVRAERSDLWGQITQEVAPPLIEGEPLRAEIRILPSGHLRAFYVPAPDESAPPSLSGAALRRVLAEDGPARILVGVRGGSRARSAEQEHAGDCIECESRVFANVPADGLPEGTALLCDVCAAKG